MKYLIDTCVISEYVKKIPDPKIEQWVNQYQPKQLFLSSITIAELKKGIHKIRVSQPERYQKLQHWLKTIESKFFLRVLPITDDVLNTWAEVYADAELQGKKLAVMDSLIASTALVHNMTVVTRNVKDFEQTGVRLLNPWEM